MIYTLLLQNTASRKEWAIRGLVDKSDTYLCYLFQNFAMPEDANDGEYELLLFPDERDDTQYELNDVLENTLAKTDVGDIMVKYLMPERHILKYGEVVGSNLYMENNREYYYQG